MSLLVVGGVFFPAEVGKEESGKAGVEERMKFSAEFGCQIAQLISIGAEISS